MSFIVPVKVLIKEPVPFVNLIVFPLPERTPEKLSIVYAPVSSILSAFILGFPANEIVIQIMAMIYMNQGVMSDGYQVIELYNLFVNNVWSFITLICTCIFTLFHFPCSTTVLTIYHETKSKIWTFLSFLLPTICGVILCFITNFILRLIFY